MSIDSQIVDEGTASSAPAGRRLKVCMHLLETARLDYRVMRDATALIEAGYEVTIVDVEREKSRPEVEVIDGVHFWHLLMPGWFRSARFKPWFLVKMVMMILVGARRLWQVNADIYHAHVDKTLVACYIAAHLRHRPLIFDSPDLPLDEPKVTRWRRLTKVATSLLSRLLNGCDGIIASSQPSVNEIERRFHVSNVTLIRNVPAYRTVARSQRLQETLKLVPGTRVALYQGFFQPSRGLERLVRAAPYLGKGNVIVLMGRGNGTTEADLEKLIAQEGVTDRVLLVPAKPPSELLDWTASADIGLTVYALDFSPNVRMCLPNKVFEYLMAGIPILSSELDAIAAIIRDYDVGQVVTSLEPAAVGAAINELLADEEGRARMRQNGLEIAHKEFYWEKESQHLLELYARLLGSRTREGALS